MERDGSTMEVGLGAAVSGGRKMGQQLGKGDGGMGLGSVRVRKREKNLKGRG